MPVPVQHIPDAAVRNIHHIVDRKEGLAKLGGSMLIQPTTQMEWCSNSLCSITASDMSNPQTRYFHVRSKNALDKCVVGV